MRSSSDNTAVSMIGVALTIIFIIAVIWYNVKHPCVEWREDTCSSQECVEHSAFNGGGYCKRYETRTYPCKTCVRRQ